jgi:hypothetical protein
MTFELGYALAVVPVLVVVTAAVWVPRFWQAALVLAGPLTTLATVHEVWPFTYLGWWGGGGVAYAVLTVPSLLPWRRRWARLAVPCTVLAVCAVFVAVAAGELPVVFYLGLPALCAVGALVVAFLSGRCRASAVLAPRR